MTRLSERRGMDAFQRALGTIARRWWMIVGVVVLVGIGTALTQISAVTAPPYTESAAFAIVAMPSGASNYDASIAQAQAEAAGVTIASAVVGSSSFDAALASRLSASGTAVSAETLQGALAATHSGDTVGLSVHWATKAGAERVLSAALTEIGVETTNGDAAGDVSQLRVVVTGAPMGAVVDQAALRAAWRGIIERLVLALVLGVALVVAVWLWEDRRRRGEVVAVA